MENDQQQLPAQGPIVSQEQPLVSTTRGFSKKLMYVLAGLVIGVLVSSVIWWQSGRGISPVPIPTKTNLPPETRINPQISSVVAHQSASNVQVWAVDITGVFPSFCYAVQPVSSAKTGNAYYVTLYALTQSEPCPEVRQDFVKTVDLDAGPVMNPGQYTVYVNDKLWITFVVPEPLPTSFTEDDSGCVVPPVCDTWGKCVEGGLSYYQPLPSGMKFCPTGPGENTGISITQQSVLRDSTGDMVIKGVVNVPNCYTIGSPYMTWQGKAVNLVVDAKYDIAACKNNNQNGNSLSLTYIFTLKGLLSGTYAIHYNGYTNNLGSFVIP